MKCPCEKLDQGQGAHQNLLLKIDNCCLTPSQPRRSYQGDPHIVVNQAAVEYKAQTPLRNTCHQVEILGTFVVLFFRQWYVIYYIYSFWFIYIYMYILFIYIYTYSLTVIFSSSISIYIYIFIYIYIWACAKTFTTLPMFRQAQFPTWQNVLMNVIFILVCFIA